MKLHKKIALGAISTLAIVSLVACGNAKKSESSKQSGPTKLLMYQIGQKPDNFDQLLANANKEIQSKLNATLDIQYIDFGNYQQKMNVIVSSGQSYDIAFANNYAINAAKGAYADLTKLFPDNAPDYYKQLNPAYIKGNTINGKLYAVPVNANVYAQQMLTFNKSYLDKNHLDVDNIKTFADATKVMEAFHKANPTVATYAVGKGYVAPANYDYVVGNGLPFAVSVTGDSKKIVNPYDQKDFQDILKVHRQWYKEGIIPADAATSNTEYDMKSNTWFARGETQGPFDYGDTALEQAAGQKIKSKAVTLPLQTTGQAQMANFVISNTSKNKELAVKVLGLINTDKKLLNGLVYGEEGKQWEKVSGKDDVIKLLPDYFKGSTHMAAWNTGNNAILYRPENVTPDMVKERDASIKAAKTSPLLGFSFDSSKVQTQISALSNVMSQYLDQINTGTVEPEETIKKMDAALKTAGYDKVLEEMQAQYDAFQKDNK